MADEPVTPPSRSGQHLRANRDQAFDVALGARIRALRVAAGLSQAELGEAAGISFQQVQKYERGKDRVSASTLLAFAAALNVLPGSFYEGAPRGVPPKSVTGDGLSAKIIVLFQEIGDARVQKRLVDLAKVLGGDEGP